MEPVGHGPKHSPPGSPCASRTKTLLSLLGTPALAMLACVALTLLDTDLRRELWQHRTVILAVGLLCVAGWAVLVRWAMRQRQRADDMLRQSETRVRSIADTALDAIAMIDQEGRITYWNTAAERMFGYTGQEAMGADLHQLLVPPRHLAAHLAAFAGFRRSGGGAAIGRTLDLEARRKDGREIPISLSLTSVRIGERWHAMGIARDETDHQRERWESQRLLRRRQGINVLQQSLLEPAALDEQLTKVTDAVVRLFDADFCRIWLTGPGDLCLQGCAHAQSGDACRSRQTCLHLVASSGRYTNTDGALRRRIPCDFHRVGRIASGNEHKFVANDLADDPQVDQAWARSLGLVSFAGYQIRVPGGDMVGVMALFAKHAIAADEDAMLEGLAATVALVARQAITQEALRQSKDEAERYAGALESSNRSLERSNRRAESATRAKSEFLANMSHEIRTPMTAILGYAEFLLGEEGLERAPAHRRQAFEAIKRNGEHLLELINGILDLSKIEAGKMDIEPARCSPFEILAEVVELMRVRADAKQLNLRTDLAGPLPETILADPLRLRQVLINLLANAIKFTDRGEVCLGVRLVAAEGGPLLRFDVSDTGIGMDQQQIARLFEPFNQVDTSASRKAGGTGLGLAISKRLTEAMGGRLEVRSAPGQGSTFSITIDPGPLEGISLVSQAPTAALPSRPPASAAPPPVALACRILVAEDGLDNQRLISHFLSVAGAEVTAVENGELACQAALAAVAAGSPYAAILMDMQMPVLDGYAATRRLRAQGYTGSIIALTAHAMAEDRQKCLSAGCNDYAPKPINRAQLLSTVARWAVPPQATAPSEIAATGPDKELLESECVEDPLIAGILEEFLNCLTERVRDMEQALRDGRYEELRRLAHQLKGSGGSYGYPSLSEAAKVLEAGAQEGQCRAAAAALTRVAALARAAQRAWRVRLAGAAATSAAPPP